MSKTTLTFDQIASMLPTAGYVVSVDGVDRIELIVARHWCELSGDDQLFASMRRAILDLPAERKTWMVSMIVERCTVHFPDGSTKPLSEMAREIIAQRAAAGKNPDFIPVNDQLWSLIGPEAFVTYAKRG